MVKEIIKISSLALLLCGCFKNEDPEKSFDKFAVVKHGDFPTSIKVSGSLSSLDVHRISFNIDLGGSDLRFTSVVPDRSEVKAGDVVMKISDEWFLREEREKTQSKSDSMLGYKQALHEQATLHTLAASDIKKAVFNLKNARDSLAKYKSQESPKKRRELMTEITSKTAALDTAIAALFQAQLDLTRAYSEDEEAIAKAKTAIKEKQAALTAAEESLSAAGETMRNFRRYEHREKIENLQEKLQQSILDIQQTMTEISVKFARNNLEIERRKLQIERDSVYLAKIQEALQSLELKAPINGTIFLDNDRWRYRDSGGLKAGARVAVGSTLATIPDISKFKINVGIPESMRALISTNLTAKITIKAIPDLMLTGKVISIANVSEPMRSWDEDSPKLYQTQIMTDSSDSRMTDGMSATVEILTEPVHNATYLPIEAVYNKDGKTYVTIEKTNGEQEERLVVTGRASFDFIEILEGVDENEKVKLSRNN